jgi:hypothetical protein
VAQNCEQVGEEAFNEVEPGAVGYLNYYAVSGNDPSASPPSASSQMGATAIPKRAA